LSSHTYACSAGSCSGTLARTAYLKYGYALGSAPATGYPKTIDPRVEAQRTVFNGDSCGGLCLHYTDSASSDYDGYGHYRQTVLDGNLGGAARTLRTEYNPDSGAWLLNRYTASSVLENGQTTQRMTYTFDGAGLEQSRRTLKGTTAGADDLLSVTCRDARGFVVSETFLGGDGRTPPDTLCAAASPVAQEYQIVHEYPPGDGFRTWHRARYSGNSFNIADETFDPSTGQVSSTRDSAGLTTTYTYDAMARLKTISPPGAASSSLVYRNASSSEPARVTSTVAVSPTIEHTYDFDGVGRLFREKRRMPDGSWALRKTDYRGAATTKFTSEWVALAAGADENLVIPTIGTTFEHDQFGRLTKVTAPDLKVMSAAYLNGGVREVQRTRTVATPSSSDTSVTVTEGYDLHGKLVSVREPAGPTTAAAPVGGEVRTDYGYDSGGKLVSVTMNPPAGSGTPAQQRQFTYDSRGLLISETHPEKELPTTYGSFDARGHAWTSTDADVPVSFQYDSAERLFRISNASGTPLKELTFGTANDCTYCNGKLRKAVRHNYLPGLGDHQVTETYTYGANGLPSKRETLVERPGSYQIQKFSQDYTYDELLALDRVDYPTCTLNGCSTTNGLLNVDHTRTRGLLTQVSGFATIGYHSSGMVSEVQRATSPVMTDTYESDQGMARPSKIKFTGATACTIPNIPVIMAASFVCTGSTGNQASVSNPQSGVTYTWTIQNGTLASTTGTSVSFTAGTSGQVTLSVTAQNACGTAASAPKTMIIPQATVSGSTTIDAGSSTYVDVALTGVPPWSLTWSDGTVSSNITTSPFRRLVSPAATTTYQLTAATDATSCSLVRTGSATITVRPAAPGWITAQATDRSVQINWQAVSVPGGARYDLERAENVNGPWTAVATATSQGSWVDTAPADPTGARRAYVYRVHTVAADGTRSPVGSSPRDYAVTAAAMYPTGGITAGVTLIQAQHVVELRRGIDALRKLVNLPEVFVSQPAPSGWVLATYFTDLLTPLDQARGPFGYGAFVYSGVERPRPGLIIKAEYVTQLREVLK
ncbi:MAG TPA: hypothetical protein VGQ36_04925, partial [Thermoanaerobaculia bacterium]|nr:hypothetical protein [Thermoanaerobaculia bacterium]